MYSITNYTTVLCLHTNYVCILPREALAPHPPPVVAIVMDQGSTQWKWVSDQKVTPEAPSS